MMTSRFGRRAFTPAVLGWYRDFLPQASDDLYGFFAVLVVPPGPPFPAELHHQKVCGVVWCYTGELDNLEGVFAPVQQPGASAFHFAAPMPPRAAVVLARGLLRPDHR